MYTYVANAACRGHRPAALSCRRDYSRPHLTASLIKERGVARFVVAPPRYGKSAVAAEYADVVFAFRNVFWLPAESPCFARDLDAGTLLEQLVAADAAAKLVVIDNLPLLEPNRAASFSDFVDALLARDIEVVVTCTPSADVYGALQHDRIKLGASDLLLTEQELVDVRSRADCPGWLRKSTSPAARVPGVAWDIEDGEVADFVKHLGDEEAPGVVVLVEFALLLLGSGDVAMLAQLCPQAERVAYEIAEDYPHLGISEETGQFDAVPAEVCSVRMAFRSKLQAVVATSSLADCAEVAGSIADFLTEMGRVGRSLEVIDCICTRAERAAWVDGNVREVARQGQFAEALEVIDRLPKTPSRMRERLAVAAALFQTALDERAGAVRRVKRTAFDSSASVDVRLAALSLIVRCSEGTMQARAESELERLLESEAEPCTPTSFWCVLAFGLRARARGLEALETFCDNLLATSSAEGGHEGTCPDDDAVCLVISWLFDLCGREEEGQGQVWSTQALAVCARAERFVRAHMASLADSKPNYFASSAALALERAHMRGLPLAQGPFDVATLLSLRTFEMSMLQQKAQHVERCEEVSATTAERSQMRADAFAGPNAPMVRTQSVPQLSVKLFGRLEVWVGDRHLTAEDFHRKTTRQLLAMLAINIGREVSRATAARLLWPESDEPRALKNFYTVWSELRRLLMLPDGTCPYLSRHELGCSLEPRYVRTDVGRLTEICRDMVFGEVNVTVWSEMFREVDRDFGDELAPFENGNELILSAREEYRMRLIDALVTAARRVMRVGEPQYAVWFARRALLFDELREDTYLVLMAAQAASGQRTAAMGTFFKLRHVLAERLGIDPSPEAVALYESLLDCVTAA